MFTTYGAFESLIKPIACLPPKYLGSSPLSLTVSLSYTVAQTHAYPQKCISQVVVS